MNLFKTLAAAALGLALCGCGNSSDDSSGGSSGGSSSLASPKALKGTQAAFAVRGEGERTPAKLFERLKGLDLPAEVASEVDDFLRTTGFGSLDVKWLALTVGGIERTNSRGGLPDVALAVAGKNDLAKLLDGWTRFAEEKGDPFAFEAIELAGVKAWHLPGAPVIDLSLASLDGNLILAAPSPEQLERQIALYRTGKDADADLGRKLLAGSSQLTVAVPDIPGLCAATGTSLDELAEAIPGGRCLADVTSLVLNASDRGEVTLEGTFANERSAKMVQDLLSGLLLMAKAQLDALPPEQKELADAGRSLAFAPQSGRTVVLKGKLPDAATSLAGFTGIAAGILLPTFSSAMHRANANALAMNGKRIVDGIYAANIDRMKVGKSSVWPHNDENDGMMRNDRDIAGKRFATSTAYFNELFDIANMTNVDNWRPYVEGFRMDWLAGDGIPVGRPGSLTAANNAWTVVSGLTDEMVSFMPALISANVDTSLFPTSGRHDMSGRTERVRIGGPGLPTLFGDRMAVVVYKGGQVRTFKQEDFTLGNIFQQNSFRIPNRITLRYLHP